MKIIVYPDPFLKQKTQDVKVFNKALQKTARKMFDLMYKQNGVGLAANQVGLSCKLVVLNPTRKSTDEIVLVNPKIIKSSGNVCQEEGCLSLPGIAAEVNRFTNITCETYNLDGRKISREFEGLLARVAQHEIDHLNGILFIDRLPEERRDVVLHRYFNGKK